ncbi:leucyl aminopeptidase family protein [Sulfitobacter sp. M57]|uniref:leucyl aminopeptidase family protein n=1 Tax=unclassified Sulfitobacter TaxID=196795 RepID=UPI0023E188AD|nr:MULTISPECIES: leucyl aminopeptidase family protein [unclassified Sulfitobacter]MDF3415299.1 leucyl aminopeptidase family protein [Sulfitobacter sp. KE5]MDF3422780.1 leucyl aminopeptidase family protein [Sulfitobacter sp. KE43]MDF3433845.1 leucyl aminopeptidase family protein [Sulfitobacter sp. KE42]MDF3459485.1 leucyl aminopeptidase family protein [Sulfitobacter sp. S74]MDF3463384.1 leucyl aminopeptidase family protein [Sulfitobacter sp. Ks18]
MSLSFAAPVEASIPLHILAEDQVKNWLATQPDATGNTLAAQGFTGGLGQAASIAGPDGLPALAVAGYGTAAARRRGRFHIAAAAAKLPKGTYHIISDLNHDTLSAEALGWLLAGYRFDRYRTQPPLLAQLVAPQGIDTSHIEAQANGEALTRTLINTPANDMGPPDLEQAARDLAAQHGADIAVITGDDLLTQNFPLIHTVGRAADRAPRLIDMRWGTAGPKLTLVGKGVCFDTGGLNLKPGASMGLMKKDMGGAAAVLGLAHMVMATGLAVQLRVLIPAVENSVAGNAFRPGDILTSRKGLTVEINNTDAEGRLVLADALALAEEDSPDQIISMATLTGAARVAVGPDLAPYFSDDAAFVSCLEAAASQTCDPIWRMPFHEPYETMIEPGIADLDNAPKGGFAGCITAALFLRRFVSTSPYAHFDIYGWQPADAPARPKGGTGQATRALFAALPAFLKP